MRRTSRKRIRCKVLLFCALMVSGTVFALRAQEPDKEKAEGPVWSGRVDLGYVQSSGNTDSVQINAGAKTQRKAGKSTFTAAVLVNYGEDNGDESVDKGSASARYNYFHRPKIFSYYEGSLEYDKFQQLDLRSKIGAGIGRRFIETDTVSLDCSAGARLIDENYDEEDDDSYGAVALGLDYENKLTEAVVFTQKLNVDISLEDSEDVLVTSETALRTSLSENLSLSITLLDNYDANPPGDLEENDLTISTSLSYSF